MGRPSDTGRGGEERLARQPTLEDVPLVVPFEE